MILLINACVRKSSRTKWLTEQILSKKDGIIREIILEDVAFPKTDELFLQKRDRLIASRQFDDPMFDLAREFANAEEIVIAAPFWDLSFPASLKQYFEQINVLGITFRYTPEGTPEGLCKAKKLTYVTTAGGVYFPEEYGFGYVKALAQSFYGIHEVLLVKAIGLDIVGADPDGLLNDTAKKYCRKA